MIAFLFGLSLPFLAAAIVWKWKRLTLVRVERRNQVVQVTLWPGEWAIAFGDRVKDYTV